VPGAGSTNPFGGYILPEAVRVVKRSRRTGAVTKAVEGEKLTPTTRCGRWTQRPKKFGEVWLHVGDDGQIYV